VASDPFPPIRSLGPADLERCCEMSTQANWNQTARDWEYLFEHALTYGVDLPDRGLMGTAVAWPISPRRAWINMVLVDEDCRGQGLAKAMFEACLSDLKAKGIIAFLDATEMGARVYRKFGFKESNELVRLKGNAAQLQEAQSAKGAISGGTSDDLEAMTRLDEEVLGGNRGSFLQRLLTEAPALSFCHRDESNEPDGFALGRHGRAATQIGPVIASELADAQALILTAAESIDGTVYLDVPIVATELKEWLLARGFEIERSFLRMGLDGGEIATDWSRYYAIAGPDYG